MKTLKFFIASSVADPAAVKKDLLSYFNLLNNCVARYGVFYEPEFCETLSDTDAHKQKQYQKICDSRFFCLLFGQSVGQSAQDAFGVALEQFRKTGAPGICTWFRVPPDGEPVSPDALDFMTRPEAEFGHYYSSFSHLDAVKLNILLDLLRDLNAEDELSAEYGQVCFDDKPLLPMENLPLYRKNKTVQALLQAEKTPENEAQLHKAENEILGLYAALSEKRRLGKALNRREKQAVFVTDEGSYEAAKTVLRDSKWAAELEEDGDAISQYISGKYLLIRLLRAEGLTEDTAEEIVAIYKDLYVRTAGSSSDAEILYDYASFLREQSRFKEGLIVARRLQFRFDETGDATPEETARLHKLFGALHLGDGNKSEAVASYSEALEAYRSLSTNRRIRRQYRQAVAFSREALDVCRTLELLEPAAYPADIPMSCNTLAVLLCKLGEFDKAEPLLYEALDLFRDLAEKTPERFLQYVANVCNNLALLFADRKEYPQSAHFYRETLNLYCRLAADHPSLYLGDVAQTCNDLANLFFEQKQYEKAEPLYREALDIRRDLAVERPSLYLPDVAQVCSNLANFNKACNRLPQAEKMYRDALEIYRTLAEKRPERYLPLAAETCNRLTEHLIAGKQYWTASETCREALTLYCKLAEQMPAVYSLKVADLCDRLADLLEMFVQNEEAAALRRKAAKIRKEWS